MHKNHRYLRRVLGLCLIITLVSTSILPGMRSTYEVRAEEKTLGDTDADTTLDSDKANVLTTDNKAQRIAQEQAKKEQSPGLKASLFATSDFEKGAKGKLEVLEGETLKNVKTSLELYLAKEQKEVSEVTLPLEIGVTDAAGTLEEKQESITVRITPEDENLYKTLKTLEKEGKLSLYHQKQTGDGNTWEPLTYELKDKSQDADAYIEFRTESLSPFLFVQTTEKKKENNGQTEKTEKTAKQAQDASQGSREVQSTILGDISVSFSDGATKTDGKWVWNPSESTSGHLFVYDLNYSLSGTELEKGALQFTLPLHILKDRDGNWADTFECPYLAESELQEGDDPDFVYKVDEENNQVIIYNYKKTTSAQGGYIEVGYSTTKSTLDYKDRDPADESTASEKLELTVSASADGKTEEKKATGDPVYIDTHATLAWTQKKANPSYYTTWQDSWGEKPEDADDYYYLVWTIQSYVNKNTQPYTFSLKDTFEDETMKESVVGYRFSGQSSFSKEDHVDNIRSYGDRYDYVLTRYGKKEADDLIDKDGRYDLVNKIQAVLTPADGVDEETKGTSSQNWYYERPKYQAPIGDLGSEKWGIYGSDSIVRDSEDISDYTLREFVENEKESIDNLKYKTTLTGHPYPYTLGDGATGTEEDALNDRYGKKSVSYELTDDTLYLEGTTNPLDDADYDITSIRWTPVMRTAVYDKDKKRFTEAKIEHWNEEDKVTIWVRTGKKDAEDAWKKATVYDMASGTYEDTDTNLVTRAEGQNLAFISGVKGVRLTCKNAYYYTGLTMYPSVSLKRTEHVLTTIGDQTKVRLTNQSVSKMTQGDDQIFKKTQRGTDYIQKVTPSSTMKKDITQTKNDKRKKQYLITWRLQAEEHYTDNSGTHSIRQDTGAFYDLLPSGAVLDLNSVEVTASGNALSNGAYTVEQTENYKDTGRTLLTVRIKEPTTAGYRLTYQTIHAYDAVKDHGKSLLNSAAYETGNDKIADGYADNGGKLTEKELMAGLDKSSEGKRFLYAEARHYISILMAGNNGLRKQVKSEKDSEYSQESSVSQDGNYSYRIRVENDKITRCKSMIFFDSLESFYQKPDETSETLLSDWKGTLTGIDLSALREQGIEPVVYLSKTGGMNLYSHHDLQEEKDGEPVWTEYSKFVQKYGLEQAHAVAVDARKKTDGTDFTLEGQKSLVFTLYMKAPKTDQTGKTDPVTYNNIYMERDLLQGEGADVTAVNQLIHQDYTALHYRVTGDIALKKVDQTDGESPVYGATYMLRGTSDYGTTYETTQVSDRSGNFTFRGIEKGTYELLETSCTDDWLLNTEVYQVTIDGSGQASIQGLKKDTKGNYLVEDAPRIHADLSFQKIDSISGNPVNGAEFVLTGTSDYGTDVFKTATSQGEDAGKNPTGTVSFDNLELGTYKLSETKAKDGYILSRTEWTVQVDAGGIVILKDASGKEVKKDTGSTYLVENEPLHQIRFLKTSTYGTNITLEGAEFSLSGVSDYGTNTAVTGTSDSAGLVVLNGLEPGTYQLKETKAPKDHDLNTTVYKVTVKSDGTYTIDGLDKITYGNTGAKIYDFKDVRTGGVVKLTKIWKDHKTNADRPVPDMTISTKKPSKNLNGYTLTFDANGGTFAQKQTENEMVYDSNGSKLAGDYKIPTNEEGSFLGWYTGKSSGTKFEVDENGNPTTPLTGDVTVYAHYQPPMKYAVAVYGIGVDDVKDEKTGEIEKGGLTFGPALGANYVQSYKSHTATGNTSEEHGNHPHRCIHDDTWQEIIEWNKEDPWVYEECIGNGCTKSVPLSKNSTTTILSGEFIPSTETGDGPSTLYYELVTTITEGEYANYNCFENLRWHPNGGTYGTNKDGWGASRIRAMLNGADDLTDKETTNYSTQGTCVRDVNKSASIYTGSNCLLATFPQALQNAIGKRAVKYDTETDLKTSYDKLWLFSSNELGDRVSYSNYNHPNEGSVYAKMEGTGDAYMGNDERKVYYVANEEGNHVGSVYFAWLRSSSSYNYYLVLCLYGGGGVGDGSASDTNGVSAGFTLQR